ncbi:Protein of unknown function UPF0146 [Methanococcus aeolicus Nankai-3]|uniref:UPF0146 protein Maeo_0637 n=1 Tax=Methanococcus aeolicus (strain ATCC BAA-1280 / DSM 17508 / OCM 812 / Nankai-3) TaxID=419665 RepID=A6UUP9_META3|nr:UPF0146 family protein [Methanococcus aeolicus]ABR56221.1 Protein of unknown function UPF0146 [Methanococcus aeolicus Nankai-3]
MDYVCDYIIKNYYHVKNENDKKNSESFKIIEIGVGYYFNIAKSLNNHENLNLIVIDANNDAVEKAKKEGLNAFVDDIFNPKLDIYKDADLIYSIRPPRDLQPFILNICKKYGISLLIKPLYGETPINDLKLINYKGNALYCFNPY